MDIRHAVPAQGSPGARARNTQPAAADCCLPQSWQPLGHRFGQPFVGSAVIFHQEIIAADHLQFERARRAIPSARHIFLDRLFWFLFFEQDVGQQVVCVRGIPIRVQIPAHSALGVAQFPLIQESLRLFERERRRSRWQQQGPKKDNRQHLLECRTGP